MANRLGGKWESANARGAVGVSSPRPRSKGPGSGDVCRPRAGGLVPVRMAQDSKAKKMTAVAG